MTRQEKEKALLMVLGFKVGDVVDVIYFNNPIRCKIIEKNERYVLHHINKVQDVLLDLPVTDLVNFRYVKIETLGSKTCQEIRCKDCPYCFMDQCYEREDIIGQPTLYEMFEIFKDDFDPVTYELIKGKLDKEVSNAKETND